jgi:hypothetical protein
MMKSLGVGSKEEIDNYIADIEWKLHTTRTRSWTR